MRIPFVGKGGSGKTTVAAMFSVFMAEQLSVYAVDADINQHLAGLLDLAGQSSLDIAQSDRSKAIKTYLRGSNWRINQLADFRKTTPPAQGSAILTLRDGNSFLSTISVSRDQLHLIAVGGYTAEGIGASCYHNDLAILENLLSHSDDRQALIVCDMVAGTDAFAGSLHAQFDVLCLVVEPSQRSLDVYRQYCHLAEQAGVSDRLVVIGNKVDGQDDQRFIAEQVAAEHVVGFLPRSAMVSRLDKFGGSVDIADFSHVELELMRRLQRRVEATELHPDRRLKGLYELHKKYVSQDYVKLKSGDLTHQIDPEFSFDKVDWQ